MKKLTLLLLFLVASIAYTQNLTISATGDTGISGANWNITGTVLNVFGTANIRASVIETALANGNLEVLGNTSSLVIHINESITSLVGGSALTFGSSTNNGVITIASNISLNGSFVAYASNIILNGNIASTLSGTGIITLLAKGYIATNSQNRSFTTQGGSILFSADTDGNNSGSIILDRASLISNGGAITLGGGNLTGSGYAVGLDYTLPSGATPNYRGIWLHSSTINAGGGNIALRGKGSPSAISSNYFWIGVDVVSFSVLSGSGNQIQTSGSGTINIDGVGGNNGYSNSHGAGINFFSDSGAQNITSANGAIVLNGTAGTGTAMKYVGVNQDGGDVNLISNSGNIDITGIAGTGVTEFGILLAGNFNVGGNGTTNTTGNVTLTSDRFSIGGSCNFRNTGNLTLQSHSSSFNQGFIWDSHFSLLGTKSGFTIGRTTNTADVTIAVTPEISGPISLYGGNIFVNESLNTINGAANGAVVLKATADIILEANKSILTNGGAVVLWSNSDGQTSNGGVFFNALANVSTVGGHVWIGGSATPNGSTTWNGLTVGDGYAVSGRDLIGFSTLTSMKIDWETGILLNETSINSGGGNIYLGGQRNVKNLYTTGAGIVNYNGATGSTIDAGTGTIEIKAFGTHNADVTAGFLTGLHPGETTGNLNILSSNSSQTHAITIEASNTGSTNNPGIVFEDETNIISSNSSNGGGISITGTCGGASNGIWIQVGTLNVLSASGKIIVDAGTKGLGLHMSGTFTNTLGQTITQTGFLHLGKKSGFSVTSSTADILFLSDLFNTNTGSSVSVETNGGLEVQSKSSVFGQTFTNTQWNIANTVSELIIGKNTNTSDITISKAQTIAGPITVYGGIVNLSQDFGVTTVDEIKLIAITDIVLASDVELSTQGGAILLSSDSDSSNGGGILITGASIVSNGGDIIMGGGDLNGSGYAEGSSFGTYWQRYRGILLNGVTIDALGGNIELRGRGWQGASWADSHVSDYAMGMDINGSAIRTNGTGTISISGIGGINYRADTFGPGVGLFGSTNIFTYSGSISISGTAGTGDASVHAGIYRGGGANPSVYSTSGSITFTGSGSITDKGIEFSLGFNLGWDGASTISSGDINLIADAMSFASGFTIKTLGHLTVKSNSDSFINNINWPLSNVNIDSALGGLTIGKATNTSNITFGSTTSIAGPITAYGGAITLDANLTTTNNGNISLYTDNPLGGLSTPRTLTASGAFKYIPRGTSFSADVMYPITNLTVVSSGLTIGNATNAKNITINADVSGGAGIALYGNMIAINANLKTTSGAAIILKGNTTIAAGKYIESDGDFTHDGNLLFKSDVTGTAAFGTLGGTYTSTSGTVQVERYIPSGRAFRFLSPSVTTTSSIYANWQENGSAAAGLGTHITGSGGATNGFDATATNNPSMFGFDHATGQWTAVTSTNGVGDVLTAGTPYRLMVRGDRTTVLTTNTPTETATTLRATGSLKTGDFTPTLNQSAEGYSFIGNPYQAPIDMEAVLAGATNMNDNVLYYWDPTLNTRGAYVTRTLSGIAENNVNSNFTEILQPGQAVFVKKDNTSTPATMTISETHKSVADGAAGVFRSVNTATDTGLLRATLQANINNEWQTTDAALALFNDSYSWNVSQEDASKMNNLDEEVSFIQNNTSLAIAKQSDASETDELPIRLQQLRHTNYRWVFDLTNYNGNTPYLLDTEQNTLSVIEDGTEFPFTVVSNTSNRFKIVFQNTTLNTPTFDNQISLYPNPSKGVNGFYITNITATAKVALFTVLGQSVPVTTALNGTTLQVKPMQDVAKGIYVVQVTSEDGLTKQVKWIVE